MLMLNYICASRKDAEYAKQESQVEPTSGVPNHICYSASGCTGGYSDKSPSDFDFLKTSKRFNLINRGWQPSGNKTNKGATLKGFNQFVNE